MSNRGFRHTGEVVAIESRSLVKISLTTLAACEGCKAKGRCGVIGGGTSESGDGGERRTMSVVSPMAQELKIGDTVDVAISYRVGMIAVVMTYIVPLVVFVGSLVAALSLGVNEGISALLTFTIVGVYYWIIYLLRDRFERIVEFDIHKK